MIQYYFTFANIATYMAVAACVLMAVSTLLKGRLLATAEMFNTCLQQVKTCQWASIAFTVLAWFLSSGKSANECLELYGELSANCSKIGFIWMVFAFASILLGFFLSFVKRSSDEADKVNELRDNSFIQAAIFLFVAFLLDVA